MFTLDILDPASPCASHDINHQLLPLSLLLTRTLTLFPCLFSCTTPPYQDVDTASIGGSSSIASHWSRGMRYKVESSHGAHTAVFNNRASTTPPPGEELAEGKPENGAEQSDEPPSDGAELDQKPMQIRATRSAVKKAVTPQVCMACLFCLHTRLSLCVSVCALVCARVFLVCAYARMCTCWCWVNTVPSFL